MGYYNPIYIYGVDKFLVDAKSAGVDGLIIVDLPPEEDSELCLPAMKAGLNFIRLATPTTDDKRLPAVLANTSGFVYYVSITGITGSASADTAVVGEAVARIKRHTRLPVCVGFGIRTPEAARGIARECRRRGGRHRAGRCACAPASMPRAGRPPKRSVRWPIWWPRWRRASGAPNRPRNKPQLRVTSVFKRSGNRFARRSIVRAARFHRAGRSPVVGLPGSPGRHI